MNENNEEVHYLIPLIRRQISSCWIVYRTNKWSLIFLLGCPLHVHHALCMSNIRIHLNCFSLQIHSAGEYMGMALLRWERQTDETKIIPFYYVLKNYSSNSLRRWWSICDTSILPPLMILFVYWWYYTLFDSYRVRKSRYNISRPFSEYR